VHFPRRPHPLTVCLTIIFITPLTSESSISYLRDCPADTKVIIDSNVVQAGRIMALIRGEIKSPDGKIVYVVVDHHKVNLGPPPDMMEHEPEPRYRLKPQYQLEPNFSLKLGGAKL
jgi:hypothetical protein